MNNMDGNIKDWYIKTYPTDELGAEIDESKTFNDLFATLDTYEDVYDFLDVYDSLVRERVFAEIANRMGVDYDYIYYQWIRGADIADAKRRERMETMKPIAEAFCKENGVKLYMLYPKKFIITDDTRYGTVYFADIETENEQRAA